MPKQQQQLDFQQVIARVAAKNSIRDDHSIAAQDAIAAQLSRAAAARVINPAGGRKVQPNLRVIQKNRNRRKEEEVKKMQQMEAYRKEALGIDPKLDLNSFKRDAIMPNLNNAHLISAPMPNLNPAQALKGQSNLALLRMHHQNAMGGHVQDGNNILQNLHDIRQMQNIPVQRMPTSVPHPNNNMLSFLHASMPNGGMNTAGKVPANLMPSQQNVLSGEAILQQLLGGHGVVGGGVPGVPGVGMPGLPGGVVRPGGMGMRPGVAQHPVGQPSPANALDEIDRALGLDILGGGGDDKADPMD